MLRVYGNMRHSSTRMPLSGALQAWTRSMAMHGWRQPGQVQNTFFLVHASNIMMIHVYEE